MAQELNQVQNEILKALEQHPDKALCTEAFIVKIIRENAKIEGKQKAGLLESKGAFYSIHINSANDIMLKKDSGTKLTDSDSRHRRLASEKSISVLSSKDLEQKKNSKAKPKFKRTESKKLNVNDFAID